MRVRGFNVEVGDGAFRLKKSFEAAEKVSPLIGIIGEDERLKNVVKVKDFSSGDQFTLDCKQLAARLSQNDLANKSMSESFYDALNSASDE